MKNNKTIILSFGHGGLDDENNYTTCKNYDETNPETWYKMFIHNNGRKLFEGVLNRQIGNKVANQLRAENLNVIIVSDPVIDTPLNERVRTANNYPDSIYVSIHANASVNHNAKGVETFYYYSSKESKKLAEEVQDLIIAHTNARNRSHKPSGSKTTKGFYELRKTIMPAILIETGFFDHPLEGLNLLKTSYQDKIADGIVDGILNYIEFDE